MAYIRTILKGSIGAVEVWSIGINWGIFGLAPDVPDQAEVDGLNAAIRPQLLTAAIPTNIKTLWSSSVQIDTLRVEKRGEAEQILSISETLLATPGVGSGTATKTPQDSLVVSLRSNTPGPSGRGRIYMPALAASLSAAFQLTGPTPANVAADTKTWLKAIGTAMNGYYASISSPKTVVLSVRSVKNHVSQDVTSLQVGSILDTQRRRRDALPETYQSVVYP